MTICHDRESKMDLPLPKMQDRQRTKEKNEHRDSDAETGQTNESSSRLEQIEDNQCRLS